MRFLITVMILLLAAGCSSRYQAPVADTAEGPRSLYQGRVHRVNTGETLYAIALMYELDYQELARANGIAPPYTIYTDQILRVNLGAAAAPGRAAAGAAPIQAARQPQTAVTAPVTITRGSDTRRDAQEISRAPLPSAPAPRTAAEPAPASPPPRSTAAAPPPESLGSAPRAAPGEFSGSGPVTWAWPAGGALLARYSDSGTENKGIDIGGRSGDAVLAAADGEVVYAGSGLLRYGGMIILKHNDDFLSAYAHNSRLLVGEGQRVSRGQKIAELGSTGIDREMLHFEIRLEGKPVDPLRYLPPR